MNINWKVRLKNKAFLASTLALVITLVYQILGLFNVVPSISEDKTVELIGITLNILTALGVILDPTTPGIGDSDRALTYGTGADVRNAEGDGGSGQD